MIAPTRASQRRWRTTFLRWRTPRNGTWTRAIKSPRWSVAGASAAMRFFAEWASTTLPAPAVSSNRSSVTPQFQPTSIAPLLGGPIFCSQRKSRRHVAVDPRFVPLPVLRVPRASH